MLLNASGSLIVVKAVQECVKAVDFALKHFQKGMAFMACITILESPLCQVSYSTTPYEVRMLLCTLSGLSRVQRQNRVPAI